MSFITDFRHFLKTDTQLGLGTAVGGRIYQGINTKNDYPVCVYNVRGGDYDQYAFAGTKTFRSTQVQLDVYVYQQDMQTLESIQESLVERLGKYSGPIGSEGATTIKTSQIRDIQFTIEDEKDDKFKYRLLVDINLTY